MPWQVVGSSTETWVGIGSISKTWQTTSTGLPPWAQVTTLPADIFDGGIDFNLEWSEQAAMFFSEDRSLLWVDGQLGEGKP